MINRITRMLEQHLSKKQQQWAWFVILWLGGLLTVSLLGYVIKLLMQV